MNIIDAAWLYHYRIDKPQADGRHSAMGPYRDEGAANDPGNAEVDDTIASVRFARY